MMKLSISRRGFLASTAMFGAAALSGGRVFAAAKPKVAAIHTVPVENAWNSRIHEAMLSAAKDGLIEYVFSECVANTDYARAMREYAEPAQADRRRILRGRGGSPRRWPRTIPKTAFLMGSSGKPEGDNFGVFGTRNHEAAYLTGMLAGKCEDRQHRHGRRLSDPRGQPPDQRLPPGRRRGQPERQVPVGFIGTWFDPPKAKEAALAQIDAGADILFGERIGTADAAKDKGVLAVGSLLNYTPRYPGTVFANAMWFFRPILDGALADVAAGSPTGKDYRPSASWPRAATTSPMTSRSSSATR